MYFRKLAVLALVGGTVLELGSCASEYAYYAIAAFVEYLPDLLDALLAAAET